ncbi:MAG: thiolase family protein [Planctomycetes bacterium]|nr:thiolase family protein [Planctomycetota bacterium]
MAPTPRPAGRPVVVTHALRTPIGKFLGSLSDLSAADLGASVVGDLLARSKLDPRLVAELIFGNGRQAGGGPNPARQVAVRAGLPVEVPAWTVNMACGSGLKALNLAVDGIRSGRNDIAIAGGTESMSRLPFMLPEMRKGYRLGHAPVVDGMYRDGFLCPLSNMLMGETAEKLAKEMGISRDEQDQFALESQQKSQRARAAKRFDDELSAVKLKTRGGEVLFATDEHARDDATLADMQKLKPVFDPKNGTVTAGNASGITDGAAALLVMDADTAAKLGFEPLAFVGRATEAGVEPSVMGIGPVPAVKKLVDQSGVAVRDYDLIELNEAFAAQIIACERELELPRERLNVNGGAISLGHPIGCTGARIVVTLLHELKKRKARRGLATLCISGGLGLATAFDRDGL